MVVIRRGGCFQAFDACRVEVCPGLCPGFQASVAGSARLAFFRVKDHDDPFAPRRIVGLPDDGQLVFFRIARHQAVEVVEQAAVVDQLGGAVARQRAACAGLHVAEPPLLEFLLEFQVHHLFALRSHAGEFFRVTLLVDDLHLVDDLGRQVLQGHRRIVGEEGLAAHGDARDGLAVILDGAVFRHLHAGHALEQVFQHGVLPELERGRVEDHGVLLDLNGIADGADAGGIQHLGIFCQGDCPQVVLPLLPGKTKIMFLLPALVAQQFHMDVVGAPRDLFELCHAQRVRQGEIRDEGIVLGRYIDRGVGDRGAGLLFHDLQFHDAGVGIADVDALRGHPLRDKQSTEHDYQEERVFHGIRRFTPSSFHPTWERGRCSR